MYFFKKGIPFTGLNAQKNVGLRAGSDVIPYY